MLGRHTVPDSPAGCSQSDAGEEEQTLEHFFCKKGCLNH